MRYSTSPFGSITPVVKNLLIINVIVFIAAMVIQQKFGLAIEQYLGLHIPSAEQFKPHQLITYMFLHANFQHIFFNMFALFMFGRMLEMVWGQKHFMIYYFVTGIGAALIHVLVHYIEIMPVINAVNYYINNPLHENLQYLIDNHFQLRSQQMLLEYESFRESYNSLINQDTEKAVSLARQYLSGYKTDFLNAHITIGASGAVFGILLAFGMLFPDTRLMLLFPPIPIRAKYFVIGYGILTLFMGVANFQFDNVAHFAHLGGMLFGYIIIKYWQKKGRY